MTILSGFKGFAMQGIAFLVIGYIFYYGFTQIYPQYADNYLYLGILLVAFTLLAGFSQRIIARIR